MRGCGLALVRDNRRVVCARGHSFDIARSGYVNLLQPQDSKSKQPGDTPEAVASRRRLHDLGVTRPLLRAIIEMARLSAGDAVLDAGCGDGFYLGSLLRENGIREAGCSGCGVDISIPAIEAAARKYPECEWVVANADRFVPYSDASFSLVLSITARMNSAEFRRVMRDDGRLLVALPAPDDLLELRGRGRERVDRTLDTFSGEFVVVGERRATTVAELDAAAVRDVLHSVYRPIHAGPLAATRVTFSLDLLLFRARA